MLLKYSVTYMDTWTNFESRDRSICLITW